jgi:hypothetical protein
MARPAKPMFPIHGNLPPTEAADDGAVSIAVACEQYLGGICPRKFYQLVKKGEIELVHEGRRAVVPVAQLKARLARMIAAQREAPVKVLTPRLRRTT